MGCVCSQGGGGNKPCSQKDVPMAVPPAHSLALPNSGTLLLWQAQTSSHPPLAVAHSSLFPSGCFHTAYPSPFPRTDLCVQASVPSPCPGVSGWWYQSSVRFALCFASSDQLLHFSLRLWASPLSCLISSPVRWPPKEHLKKKKHPFFLFSLSFFLWFCPFWKSAVLCSV